jgi:FSR family fosmidomycin resistance protein-like MFS transporter
MSSASVSVAALPRVLPDRRSHVTLALTTLLHAFTHAYGVMLVPLYLLIVSDLGLSGVKQASLVVTIYGVVYAIFSFPAGMLADHTNRKMLLGLGLIVNATAILMMGLTHHYAVLIALAVFAGLAGTIFHPAANALIPAHYPRNPASAIGMLGMGSGIGFFAGPQVAGWRAEAGGWHWDGMADWQRPCVEMGLAGIAFGLLFLLVAQEVRSATRIADDDGGASVPSRVPLGSDLRWKVLTIALILCTRDFAGLASLSLASIYFQKALGFSVKQAGFTLGATLLVTIIVNPLIVFFTPGKRRLPTLAAILVIGGLVIASVPFVGTSVSTVLPVLCIYQVFHLGSYAVSESAMLERVSPDVRGRVIGLFLTVAGTVAGTGPWAMGFWTDHLGDAARTPAGYVGPFGLLGALLVFSSLGTFLIARLGKPPERPQISPATELMPRTVEPIG